MISEIFHWNEVQKSPFSHFIFLSLTQIWGLNKKYWDYCYGNGAKVCRLKPLAIDWPWTLYCMHTKLYHSCSLPVFIAVLGRKVCRVRLCHYITGSISDHGRENWAKNLHQMHFSQAQHCPASATTIFAKSHPLQFFPLSKNQISVKGTRFQDVDEIQDNATRQLIAIPKKEFQEYFYQWKWYWIKCVALEGDYFEGD